MKRTRSTLDVANPTEDARLLVPPRVINVRAKELRKHQDCENLQAWLARDPDRHLYVGRVNFRVKGTFTSKWHNPFRMGRDDSREQVARRYRQHVLASPALRAALPELTGCTLGCWCDPQLCHAHVLRDLWHELVARRDNESEEIEEEEGEAQPDAAPTACIGKTS